MRATFNPDVRRIVDLHQFLPPDTCFHNVVVPNAVMRGPWFAGARAAVQGADVVFCDPDNGVAFAGVTPSERHVGTDEARALFAAGHSLVLYHHLNRQGTHHQQVINGLRWFRQHLPNLGAAWGFRFARGSSRVFFVLAQPQHCEVLRERVAIFRHSQWVHDGHFEVHDTPALEPA